MKGPRRGCALPPAKPTRAGGKTQEAQGGNVHPNRHSTRDVHREPQGTCHARHQRKNPGSTRTPKRADLREHYF